MWDPPVVQPLTGDRLHLQHGPIDVVLKAWGANAAVAVAYQAVAARFTTILGELTSELTELRRPMADGPRVEGVVARRMIAACRSYREFVTPMAAVAGAVADELLSVMIDAAPLDKAFVNDGGDIAVHLTEGETLAVAMASDFSHGPVPALGGGLVIGFDDRVGGIATSGARGRSLSLGIADSVTVLALDAARADVAATLIANAVDLPGHPAITRHRARDLDPDSDLGDLLATAGVGDLTEREVADALASGLARADAFRAAGLIRDCALTLRQTTVALGPLARPKEIPS